MKKIFGKALTILMCAALAMTFLACKDGPKTPEEIPESPAYTITAPEGQGATIKISEDGKTITLEPEADGIEYTITGDFEGQIINKRKGTVIVLNNVNLKNTEGKAAIYGELNKIQQIQLLLQEKQIKPMEKLQFFVKKQLK